MRASLCCGLSCCGAQAPDAQAQRPWLTGPAALRHVGPSQTGARTRFPCIGGRTRNHRATREALSFIFKLSGCQPAPEGYSPTLQWQQQQVAQFSTVRQSVNRHRSHWKSQQLDSNVTMPKSEDEEGWKKFCLGERLCAEGAVGPAASESPGIDYVQIGFPPLLSIVSRMNQATVTSVLEYLSNWFGERDFTPELGRWLYALLACLEKPLLPEAHSLIRQLARRCSEVRLLVDSKDDERVPALNLLICLVSRYFDQRDLADEPS
ncbi:gem-associated protein 2 isoform X4 [Physeter macrocephalus]|uniref:Gem-associated protein 2 n=1 Tax=Physeter macrocephalus TaxID=9755 RepID=A0A9W2WYT9_PHYMC|nr:gem-associated protein 2 isoform X4 [Physeter catodon]